jgi:hypothetical protein
MLLVDRSFCVRQKATLTADNKRYNKHPRLHSFSTFSMLGQVASYMSLQHMDKPTNVQRRRFQTIATKHKYEVKHTTDGCTVPNPHSHELGNSSCNAPAGEACAKHSPLLPRFLRLQSLDV